MKTTTIRLSDRVFEEIKNTGSQNKRSVNAEINFRLEKILEEKEKSLHDDDPKPAA